MRKRPLATAVQIRGVEIVQVLKIVCEIRHDPGLLVHVESTHGALSRGNGRHFVRCKIDAKNMSRASHARFKTQLIRARYPMQIRRNQVEFLCHQSGRRAPLRVRKVQLRKLPPRCPACEHDLLSVRRPAGKIVLKRMIGDPRHRSPLRGNHPDVLIVSTFVLLAGAVGNERDAGAVRRPLRIGIVPVFARSDLILFAGRCINHPKVTALVVVPAGVVELV